MPLSPPVINAILPFNFLKVGVSAQLVLDPFFLQSLAFVGFGPFAAF
jgi:hypothetical protein